MQDRIPGLIVCAQSGFFTVRTDSGDTVCQLRGRLKQARRATDLAAVGDRVLISIQPDGSGAIEEVLPRTRVLSRRSAAAGGRGGRTEAAKEQVLVANPDQAVFVFACAHPAPHPRMLDRFLVTAERAGLPAAVCVNKIDLSDRDHAEAVFSVYRKIGYPVLYTSALTGEGCAELGRMMAGKLTVFSGPSGVGKSSLLNRIRPDATLRVGEVGAVNRKGRHTTVTPELIALEGGGYVADTPGLREIGFWDISPEELDAYFPEIRPLVDRCAYGDCTHERTPGCAVQAAVEAGEVTPERYDSFLRMRRGGG